MDLIAAQATKPPVSRRGIYWLASYPRSGNIWLRAFVANVLDILREEPLPATALANLMKYTAVERMQSHYAPFVNRQDAVAHPLRVMQVRPHAQQKLAESNPYSIFAKTQSAAAILGGVPQINPLVTRGAAYLIRNPLDVACSMSAYYGVALDDAIERMGMRTFTFATAGDEVAEFVGSWSVHVESWTEASQLDPFVLRYEDLLADPVRAFSAFARHAAIKATAEQIRQAAERVAFARLQAEEAAARPAGNGAAAFFRYGGAGAWRQTLTPAQVARIVADHGKWMERFGYLPEQAERHGTAAPGDGAVDARGGAAI